MADTLTKTHLPRENPSNRITIALKLKKKYKKYPLVDDQWIWSKALREKLRTLRQRNYQENLRKCKKKKKRKKKEKKKKIKNK